MKVLTINTYHYLRGGDCRLALETADLLKQNGHETIHFSMQGDLNLPCANDEYFIGEIDYRKALKRKNPIQMVNVLWHSIYSAEARKKISLLLDRHKPDIAHIHSIRHHLTTSIIPELKKRNIPIVWTLHDYKELCPNTTFYNGLRICEQCKGGKYANVIWNRCKKQSFAASLMTYIESRANELLGYNKYVDRFIAPSIFLRDKFIEYGYHPEKVIHLPNFIDTDRYQPYYRHERYILFIGRLESEKGVGTLLKAFNIAQNKIDNPLQLKLAGTGSMEADLKGELKASRDVNVQFLGYQQGAELEDLTKKAMGVVIPSEWYENYPFSALEAMVYGKPVIASRIGGLPEIVTDGVTGFLFEPFKDDQLSSKLETIASMPDQEIIKMGKAARKQVENNNHPTIYLENLVSIYKTLNNTK